jgi:hypothetical protein
VILPKISKPLGRKNFFQLEVGREEKSLETYAVYGIRKQPIFSHETT